MATMRDIADACRVSVQTVSRILRGHGKAYRPETVRQVMATARQLRYEPPWQSLASSHRAMPTLGGIALKLDSNAAARRWGSLSEAAREAGYALHVCPCHEMEQLPACAQSMQAMGIKGLFTMGGMPMDRAVRQPMAQLAIPTVYLDWGPPNVKARIMLDRRAALEKIAHHLARLGHTHVGFMARLWTMDFLEHKLLPLRRALARRNMKLITRPDWFFDGHGDVTGQAHEAALNLMAGTREVTAVICGNDEIALAVTAAIHQTGFRVPQDMSVVGFDNLPITRFSDPPLTTVQPPCAAEVAQAGMRMMLDLLANLGSPVQQVTIAYELIVRQSTGPVPAATHPTPDSMAEPGSGHSSH